MEKSIGCNDFKKVYSYPYEIEDEQTRRTLHIEPKDIIPFKVGRKTVMVCMFYTTDKEECKRFTREFWKWLAIKDNESRCLIPDGKGGFIRCHKNCSECPQLRSGRPESVDYEEEENGYEVVDHSSSFDERLALKITFEFLLDKLRTENPQYASLIEMMYKDCSQEEIAISTNKSPGTIGEQATRALNLAKEIYKDNKK